MIKYVIFSFVFLFFITTVFSQQHQEDFWITDGSVNTILPYEEENLLYIGGDFNNMGSSLGHGIILNSSSLNLADNFPKVNGYVGLVAPDGTGGFFIAGSFTRVDGVSRNGLARIKSDRTLDLNFNPDAGFSPSFTKTSDESLYEVSNRTISRVTTSGIGGPIYPQLVLFKIFDVSDQGFVAYIAGRDTANQTTRNGIFQMDITTGALIENFFYPMSPFNVRRIIRTTDALYIAGYNTLVKLDPITGEPLQDFNVSVNGWISDMVFLGGNIIVGGSFLSINGTAQKYIAKLDIASGNLITWDPQVDWYVSDLYSVSNNRLLLSGNFGSVGGQPREGFAVISSSGQVLNSGPKISSTDYSLAFSQSGNHVYIGGIFITVDAVKRAGFAAIDMLTGIPQPVHPEFEGGVYALARDANELFVGGSYYFENVPPAQQRNGLASIDLSTGELTSWKPNPWEIHSVTSLALTDDFVFIGGEFEEFWSGNTQYIRTYLASFSRQTGQITTWEPELDNVVDAILVHDNNLYVAGSFSEINGQPRNRLASFTIATGELTDWNPNPSGRVRTLAKNETTLFAGGSFSSVGGTARSRIAAFDLSTGELTEWQAETERGVRSLTVAGNMLIAGAGTSPGGDDDSRLRAYRTDMNTNNRINWITNMNRGVTSAYWSPISRKTFIGGDFERVNNDYPRHGIAVLDGLQDPLSVQENNFIVNDFYLYQNYPNPFNPKTVISYQLPISSNVILKVYDLLGRKIATLVDEYKPAGSYKIQFDASQISSGVYFYTLTTGNNSATRKLLLLR